MLEVNQRIQYVSGRFYYSEDTRTTTKTSVRKERERVVCIDVDACVLYGSSSSRHGGKLDAFST